MPKTCLSGLLALIWTPFVHSDLVSVWVSMIKIPSYLQIIELKQKECHIGLEETFAQLILQDT
jgi:hypothetical protein